MDRQHIRDEQVVERYLKGALTAAEEQAFEEAYLGDPELLEELEAAERLRAGLEDVHAPGLAAGAPPRRARWLEVASSPRYGIAASFVAVAALVSTTALYMQNGNLRDNAGFTAAAPARVLELVSVRGQASPNEIAAPARGEWIVLLVDAGLGDYDAYRAVLARDDGADVVRLDGLTPSSDGLLALGVAGEVLSPGEYEIRLFGGRRDWPATRALDELGGTSLTIVARP
jgi:hypothetical protein